MHWLNAGFDIFPLLNNLSWTFFLIVRYDPLQIVALVRLQALFETIIDSGIASLNGAKTHMHAMRTNSFKYIKFHNSWFISICSSIGKVLGWWVTANQFCWFSAGWDIFPKLDNPSWTAFFSFYCWFFLLSMQGSKLCPIQSHLRLNFSFCH